MARVLCVDYGRSRVGLAVSDALGHTAQPLEVIQRPKRGSLIEAVAEVVDRVEADEIVVGLPLKLDGTPGVAADAARQFAKALEERCRRPVTLWDERLSTVEASREMRRAGVNSRKQRGVIDKVAAAVVLRAYLSSRSQGAPSADEAYLPEPDEPPPPRPDPWPRSEGRPQRKVRRSREDWRFGEDA